MELFPECLFTVNNHKVNGEKKACRVFKSDPLQPAAGRGGGGGGAHQVFRLDRWRHLLVVLEYVVRVGREELALGARPDRNGRY